MSQPHFKLIARLSVNFLAEALPDNWQDMSDDELDMFMRDHHWEPFEYWDTDDVFQLIEQLAYDVHNMMEGK